MGQAPGRGTLRGRGEEPGGRPDSARRRDHRGHGPQRIRQVLPPLGPSGLRPPQGRHRDRELRQPEVEGSSEAFGGGRLAASRLVPQTPTDLLYLESVKQELDQADTESGVSADGIRARAILDRLALGIPDTTHPRDLSEGQKLALVLAIQLTAAPKALLLDEPTRGLDYRTKNELIRIVDDLAAQGRTVVISTHDVEFVARAAGCVVVMAEGDIVADGPTTEVIVASPVFAPQTAKILALLRYLTVAQVAATLSDHETDPAS